MKVNVNVICLTKTTRQLVYSQPCASVEKFFFPGEALISNLTNYTFLKCTIRGLYTVHQNSDKSFINL